MNSTIEQVAAGISRLPAIPSVAGELLRLCRENGDDENTLNMLIRSDPALLCYILKVSNAAYFGKPAAIFTLTEAIEQLGIRKIRDIAKGHACFSLAKLADYPPQAERCWQHILLRTIAAECVAEQYSPSESEYFMTLTALSHIGELAKINQNAVESLNGNTSDEKKLFLNFDQHEFGAIILKKWNLPEQIPIIIRSLNNPDAISEMPMLYRHVRFVLLARELADYLRHGNHSATDNRRLWDAVNSGLCASTDAFITLAGSIRQRVQNYIRAILALGIRVGDTGL
ncbi:MAG: HDOD domain-containing protein [Calditrichia bacterium]